MLSSTEAHTIFRHFFLWHDCSLQNQGLLWCLKTRSCRSFTMRGSLANMGQNYSHSYLTMRPLMLDVLMYLHFTWYVSLWKENFMIYFQEATLLVNSHSSACGAILQAPFFDKPQYIVLGLFNSWLDHEKLDCLVLGFSLSIFRNSVEQNLSPNTSCLAQMHWHANRNLFSVNISV